jgi:4a-hydroxytetrahydrobiopterin dehydratase
MSSREKLTDDAIAAFLASNPGWTREGDGLVRTYKFDDYGTALGFVVRVGVAAEKRDHHPDIHLTWGRAKIVWSTHDTGGITKLDVEMAERTDQLYGK